MSNLNTLDITPLDATGIGYHKWARDALKNVKAQGIISAIPELPVVVIAPSATLAQGATDVAAAAATTLATADALEAKNVKAIIIMIRHMNESLPSDYLNEEDPQKFWVALEERFGNIRESLLLDLKEKWQHLHFCDYSSVLDFN